MEAVEADFARRLADEVAAAGVSDPVEALRHAVRTWLATKPPCTWRNRQIAGGHAPR